MSEQETQAPWHTRRFRAMGSEITIWLELADEETAVSLLSQAEGLFMAVQRRLSRFQPDSELSQLNARPAQWVTISGLLWQVLTQALYLAAETRGLFDPTLLNALEAAGYDQSFEALAGVAPTAVEMAAKTTLSQTAVTQTGQWQAVQMDQQHHAVWLPPQVRIDLGGIAKGYTAQQVVNFLSHWGPCLVDAGGDITAGDAPAGWQGWPVGVLSPWIAPDAKRTNLITLWLVHGSMATSGIDYRCWQADGRTAHHLIDPRTGRSAQSDVLTVTVLAGTAVRAEVWATASLIAGTSDGGQLLADHNLAAAFIDQHQTLITTPALEPFLTR